MRILVLNPGSTSLKLAIYEDDVQTHKENIRFAPDKIEALRDPEFRLSHCVELLEAYLADHGLRADDFDCAVSRGGLLGSVKTGAYRVNERMLDYILSSSTRVHSVGVPIAYNLMQPLGKPAYIYDAVTADEWDPITKISGLKGYSKPVTQHTLNCRRILFELSKQLVKPINEINAIMAHLGGGVDVAFFRNGRNVESLGFNDLGFATDRCGAIRYLDAIEMAQCTPLYDLIELNRGQGGLVHHFGTASVEDVETLIDAGDEYAALVLEAMAYRVAQCIGAGAATLNGNVDVIVLTGGIAYSKRFTDWIISRVNFLAPIQIIPGEMEIEALAQGALRVMRGLEEAHEY